MTSRQVALRIIGILVVVACLARVVHLNADPSVPTWIGYVADEGRWSETARTLALFGTPEGTPNARLQLFISPGYQVVNYVAFRSFGVDFWSARFFAAVCGSLTVVVVFFALRRHVTPFALALGVVILGFETNLLSESRMALPEMPSVFFSLLAFLVLVLRQKTRRNAFIAGTFAAVAVAMKATTIIVLPVFSVIILLVPQGSPARDRVARVFAFVAGFALLVVAGVGGALASGFLNLEGITFGIGRIFDFVPLTKPTQPYIAVMRFFDSPDLEARNLLLLGVWFCSWLWFHRKSSGPTVVSELYLASGAWLAWWLIAWSGSQYLPGRYVVHWIVPATIHVMAGLSLAGRDTVPHIVATLVQRRMWMRGISFAWLVLPSAIFLAAMAAGLAELCGWDYSSLTRRIALIAALTGVLALATRRRESHPNVIAAFLLFPVVMTLIWLGGRELGLIRYFWQFTSGTSLAIWTAVSGLTFVACLALARPPRGPQRLGVVQAGIVVVVAGIFFAQGAPAILWPTYSIRNASLDLQQRFPAAAEMRTFTAESLFLANKLKFHSIGHQETRYDGIVVFEHGVQPRNFLASRRATNLERVAVYPVTVNPRYETNESRFGPASIGVYKPR